MISARETVFNRIDNREIYAIINSKSWKSHGSQKANDDCTAK